MIKIKRIYEQASVSDGYRILIDRLWPRDVSKEEAKIDIWMKEIAPSNELRKWFAHDLAKWNTFKTEYTRELEQKKDLSDRIRDLERTYKTITLLYGAADEEHNQAVVLAELLGF